MPGVPRGPSLTPTADIVNDLFSFGPSYQFNLASLDEYYKNGTLTFYGYLTVIDTTNAQSPAFAQFTANGFVDQGGGVFSNGSFTFAATSPVPEPTSLGLLAFGALVALRRRQQARV